MYSVPYIILGLFNDRLVYPSCRYLQFKYLDEFFIYIEVINNWFNFEILSTSSIDIFIQPQQSTIYPILKSIVIEAQKQYDRLNVVM